MRSKEQVMCEDATGCPGAGDYREYARQHGYPHCLVWDWTSSAGDWSFLVSKDGKEWVWMFQENNYPHPGFTLTICEHGEHYYGIESEKELFALVEDGLRW